MREQDEKPVTPEIDAAIPAIIDEAGATANAGLIASILATGIALGTDATSRLDLKITSAAVSEMREAFTLFRQFTNRPKVTVFGSARTKVDTTLYALTRRLAAALAERDW